MSDLITINQPNSPQAEKYRALRGRLLHRGDHSPERHAVFGVTTPQEGVDTAAVIANLAVSVAQSGRSVALIEADLRQPALAALFALSAEKGLANALAQTGDEIDLHWQATEIGRLQLLAGGQAPGHPADLLFQPRMGYLLDHVRESAEVVLVHLPAADKPECSWLASQTDGVLMVAERGRTKRRALAQAKSTLEQAGCTILGSLLSR